MKKYLFTILAISSFVLFSCEKSNVIKDKEASTYEFPCKVGECDKCADTEFLDPSIIEHDLKKIVVEPVLFSEACGCYISGLVKYTDCGVTTALVSYGNGECDGVALKTTCVNGDCNSDLATTCEIVLVDCEFN